ncbi:MAG TPA: hypothetical protein VGK46_06250 [Saprospiraceae bacterium]|jgi:hypothetical protein
MRHFVLLLMLLVLNISQSLIAQSWDELTDEQKVMKLQSFMEDNQRYMRETLGLTEDQVLDVESVNACFLNNLDVIANYGGSDSERKKYAKSSVKARQKQLQAIMGTEKFEKFQSYVSAKLQKAMAEMK